MKVPLAVVLLQPPHAIKETTPNLKFKAARILSVLWHSWELQDDGETPEYFLFTLIEVLPTFLAEKI
jgi:hypothetical protein